MDDLYRALGENEAHMQKAMRFDDNVRRSAEEELSRIDVRLMSMPSGQVARNSAMAFEYRRLVDDRARLLRMVAGL